jgi:hypothetical protein
VPGRGRAVTHLLLVPPALSLLVLAAHFLRGGDLLPLLVCIALLPLLAVARPWATRVLQAALLLGAIEWIRTGMTLVPARQAAGAPWERMALILEVVAWVTFLSALLFELPPLRRRDGRSPERAGGSSPGG